MKKHTRFWMSEKLVVAFCAGMAVGVVLGFCASTIARVVSVAETGGVDAALIIWLSVGSVLGTGFVFYLATGLYQWAHTPEQKEVATSDVEALKAELS